MERKKKIIALCHLSLALALLFWLLSSPFLKEFIIKKSAFHLYQELSHENISLNEISDEEMELMKSATIALQNKSIWIEFITPTKQSTYVLTWLVLSLTLPILFLKHIRFGALSMALLPIIALLHLIFMPSNPQQTLYPSKEYVIQNYIEKTHQKSPSKEALEEGYRHHLIQEWGEETRSKDPDSSQLQYRRALLNFNRFRLKQLCAGHYTSDLIGLFFGPPSRFTKVIFMLWNLFFALILNFKITSKENWLILKKSS